MKIVVLDGFTLNPGDLSWEGLQALGETVIHDRSAPEEVVPRARDAEVVLTNKVALARPTLAALPNLRYIGVMATGYNIVDVQAAREKHVPVTNVPDYGTAAVAQMTFALLLELCHRAGHHAETVRNGRWTKSLDFCYWDYPLVELAGKTLGIIGFGRIGQAVARIGAGFGLKIAVAERPRLKLSLPEAEAWPLDRIFHECDVVSLHCPLTSETQKLVNAERLAMMKPEAFLVNTSRGGLIDDQALAAALNSGRIAGAALDVLSTEPPPADNPLLGAKNCIITPHIAWAAKAARERMMRILLDNLRSWMAGAPKNVVNP